MQVDCIWFIEFQLETNLHQPPKCSHHQSDEARAKHSLWNTDAIQIYAKHAIDTSFYATKNGFFCTRNLNCKPMILYGKYQLIQTYRVVLTYEARLTKMNRSQLIFTSTCWREWFKVWNGQMPKHNLKCDPLCQCAVLNSLHGIHAHAYTQPSSHNWNNRQNSRHTAKFLGYWTTNI